MQGLACKLGGSEQFASEELKITVKPRIAMEVAMAQQENAAAINVGSAQIGAMVEPENAIGGMTNFDAA